MGDENQNVAPPVAAPESPAPDPLAALAARIELMAQRQEQQSQVMATLVAMRTERAPQSQADEGPPADPDIQRLVANEVRQAIQPYAQQAAATHQMVYNQRGEEVLRAIGATPEEVKAVREKLNELHNAGITFNVSGRQVPATLEFAANFVLGEQRVKNAMRAPAVRSAVNASAVVESAARAAPAPAAPAATPVFKRGRMDRTAVEKLEAKLNANVQGDIDLFS